jgi:hypothetical protein
VNGSEVEASVSFDYGCPFSYMANKWLDAAGARVDFRPFSLAEVHRTPGDLPAWQVPVDRLDPVVLSMAGHELVRESGGDLDDYRRQMFAFWHEESHRTFDGLVAIMSTHTGEAPTLQAVSRGLAAVKKSHQSAAAQGVFGTPTIKFDAQPGMYLKLDDLPADDASARNLWQHLTAMAHGYPALLELKRAVR